MLGRKQKVCWRDRVRTDLIGELETTSRRRQYLNLDLSVRRSKTCQGQGQSDGYSICISEGWTEASVSCRVEGKTGSGWSSLFACEPWVGNTEGEV